MKPKIEWPSLIGCLVIAVVVMVGACSMSCATTTLYRDGRPMARIQGDFKGTLTVSKDGSASLSGTLAHSPATKAGGEAAGTRLNAASAIVTAAVLAAP